MLPLLPHDLSIISILPVQLFPTALSPLFSFFKPTVKGCKVLARRPFEYLPYEVRLFVICNINRASATLVLELSEKTAHFAAILVISNFSLAVPALYPLFYRARHPSLQYMPPLIHKRGLTARELGCATLITTSRIRANL